jgi:hypothetical protein
LIVIKSKRLLLDDHATNFTETHILSKFFAGNYIEYGHCGDWLKMGGSLRI